MTPIIDVNTTVTQTLPFSKRLTKWVLFVQSVCFPTKWLNTNVLTGYRGGTGASNYDPAITYDLYNQVIYNYGVWESLVSGNTGNTPDASPLQWMKVNDSFIGATERAHFGQGRLQLEYALNRYFQSAFRPPASYSGGDYSPKSDIYLTNDEPAFVSFSVGTDSQPLGAIGIASTNLGIGTDSVIGDANSYSFTMHIPTGVLENINTDFGIAQTVINNFFQPILISGVRYSVVNY